MIRINKYRTLLQAVNEADNKTRIAIVRHGPPDFIKALIEIALNFLKGNIRLSHSSVNALRKNKTKLRQLAACRGKKGICTARKKLIQKGGFLPLIPLIALAASAPAIASRVAQNATNSAINTLEKRAKSFIDRI